MFSSKGNSASTFAGDYKGQLAQGTMVLDETNIPLAPPALTAIEAADKLDISRSG
jgi:hypothetical protein